MLIDNLQQVAIDLYFYLKNADNNILLNDIYELEKNYSQPIYSWLYGNFYQYFRTRLEDIELLKNQLITADQTINLAEFFYEFLQKGAWETTSANTFLMLKFIQRLPTYSAEIDQPFLTKQVLIRLHLLFAEYVVKLKTLEDNWFEQQKYERKNQLQNLSWPNISTTSKQIINCITYMHSKTNQIVDIKKFKRHADYNEIFLKLENSFRHSFHTVNFSPTKEKSMTYSRQITLAKILKYHFLDGKIKTEYRLKIKSLLERELITRAFDDFDFPIIASQDLKSLSKHLIHLLPALEIDAENIELSEESKKKIKKWETKLIKLACTNLLDGVNIKKEILNLLAINSLNPKQTLGLICAYVGRLNQDSMNIDKVIIEENQQKFFLYLQFHQ